MRSRFPPFNLHFVTLKSAQFPSNTTIRLGVFGVSEVSQSSKTGFWGVTQFIMFNLNLHREVSHFKVLKKWQYDSYVKPVKCWPVKVDQQ